MSESTLPDSFYVTNKVDFSKAVETGNLKNKSVVVTGGANGLGAGCVAAFAQAGAYVTILDLNEEKGSALTESLSKDGHHVQFIKADVSSFESQNAGFKSAISFHPHNSLDIVLTSAGINATSLRRWFEENIASSDPDPAAPPTTVLDVNLTGTFHTAHLALYYFHKTLLPAPQEGEPNNPSKQLIFFSSVAGYVPLNNVPDYQASKFGVRGLWKSIRHSVNILAPHTPFRTNLIAPTFIKTDMTAGVKPLLDRRGVQMGEVEDAVAGVLRVACDETVYGRAVVIASKDEEGKDRNFDFDDDWEGCDAGREVLGKIVDGTLGGLQGLGVERGLVYEPPN
ncbi:hypothetical protein B0J11DRAFT_535131 [Dendryphion nanum]|uniref:NAD(P)-binding protein n=1 Tax=Dendryphion nanum TaxID=256645 RepID=A0A9P9IGQ7_9PLEO|nr:hypothetical protein B0J11DRAFT_535131 [Dendryphion nanum]